MLKSLHADPQKITVFVALSARLLGNLHTLLDLRGSIPSWVVITDGKIQDVNLLDPLVCEAGAF